MNICKVTGCDKRVDAKSLCSTHYSRLRKTGDAGIDTPIAKHTKRKECEVSGCNNLNVSTKLSTLYCGKHYARLSSGKSITAPTARDHRPAIIKKDHALIPLGINSKDGFTIVDTAHASIDKYKWRLSNDGYAVSNSYGERGINNRLHHLVFGKPPKGMMIDHINRNKLDNRMSNLREVTPQINTINRGMQSNNTSGYTGVRKHKDGKWVAYLRRDGKVKSVYGFKSPEDASVKYLQMMNEHKSVG